MIAYFDTEVSVPDQKVTDYGAVREDGAILHTHVASEFQAFVKGCNVLCGHNILRHDLKYLSVMRLEQGRKVIDTLFLSPLLFPKKPYHKLVKDDKLQSDELNNPANDAQKARDLFCDEVAAWQALSPTLQTIYYQLLHDQAEFAGFFDYLGFSTSNADLEHIIEQEFRGRICSHANLAAVVKHYPVELAYTLAVIGTDDFMSITPAWVVRNYPKVSNVMNFLRNTPCGNCDYCRQRLDAHQGLKEFFGFDQFRTFDGVAMQQQAVESALRGESLLTIFPTGGGKSLTFQLPALMAGRNCHGLTVVISPLQSLMKDQVDNLTERGIGDAVTINGLLDPLERAEAVNQVLSGGANLLYIAPEMLRSATIKKLLSGRNIVRFVIDEAHCFSAWGHDFRVDYLYIGDFIKELQELRGQKNPIAVSCFTATAKQKVISDIADYFHRKLGLTLKIFAASAERKNLRYSVIHAETPGDKYNQLRNLILGHNCPTIVYVSRTRQTKEISQHLRADGIQALPFNGKMEAAEKVQNQNAFMSGAAQVVVATSAFGMGVDKKDVGLVVHYDISDSLENYVQEAGRAGRDPKMEAACYVLFSDNDLDKHFILLNQTKLSISEIQQVWKAIKDFTSTQEQVSCSPLEIARQAGWNEEVIDIETRVKAAIAALEESGFIQRGNNVPHIFATSIAVRNMDEARHRLNLSPLFDQYTREEAARIIGSLISSKATAGNRNSEAESRIDYLADMLGMAKETVIRNVNLMRQEGILADSRDMMAWIAKSTTARELEQTLKLEHFLLTQMRGDINHFNYKELNELAMKEGVNSSVKRIKTLFYFLTLKGYIRKEEHTAAGNVVIQRQKEQEILMASFEQRTDICRYVVKELSMAAAGISSVGKVIDPTQKSAVSFSIVGLMESYKQNHQQLALGGQKEVTLNDFEEALLYLSKNSLLKIDGGFLVIYNTMQLTRKVERRVKYSKEHYRLLDEFYKQRIQQIHIVGEYTNLMVKDYDSAIQYVSDYFQMDFKKFIGKYFKGERKTEINNNITPNKYKQIFGGLDPKQLAIINDKQSKYIVVAAGPGSGKTRVLVHKLASLLLMEDVKHEQLLMLTFSRSAATEFKKRLMELIGNAAHFVEIKTFHSFSFDILGKMGNLTDAQDVVRQAAMKIESGDVEEQKIAKSVLVIDEAQDMGADDFQLVKALMNRNEEMRVIAVGDDDQNIYGFRGSDSRYLQSMIDDQGATLYEMTTNYRSTSAIVDFSNRFATLLPARMKKSSCTAFSQDKGIVQVHQYDSKGFLPEVIEVVQQAGLTEGTTCLLTPTNEEALQAAYLLEQQGLHTRLIQSIGGFSFHQLAEIRYFLKQLSGNVGSALTQKQWDEAKERTLQAYHTSSCIEAVKCFFADFEKTHRTLYYSDLKEYLFESNIEDFVSADRKTIFISTIHKAKGREFDTVHLVAPQALKEGHEAESLRALYVGITRAKRRLFIHSHAPFFDQMAPPVPHHVEENQRVPITIALTHRDVFLDYFKERKRQVLKLRSGDPLLYANGHLSTPEGVGIAALSNSKKAQMQKLEAKGYQVVSAEVSFIVAWKPKEEQQEYAVCLATLHLVRVR